MNIFYKTLEKFKDFTAKTSISIKRARAGVSLYENILRSFEAVLDEQEKMENKKYIGFQERLSGIIKDIESKQMLLNDLERLVIDFQDAYKKKRKDIELAVISQKAFIRIKEEEVINYLAMYAQKQKEKQDIASKKEEISGQISFLKNQINAKCLDYMEKVKTENTDVLRSDLDKLASNFFEAAYDGDNIGSDYVRSDEYLHATIEYKEAYIRLYTFMGGIFDSVQKFMEDANIEKILPDILGIQEKLKHHYITVDELDNQIAKINDYLDLKPKYEDSLKKEREELEEIASLIEKDEGLLIMQSGIEEYISRNEGSLL
jgi:hypothetical protein